MTQNQAFEGKAGHAVSNEMSKVGTIALMGGLTLAALAIPLALSGIVAPQVISPLTNAAMTAGEWYGHYKGSLGAMMELASANPFWGASYLGSTLAFGAGLATAAVGHAIGVASVGVEKVEDWLSSKHAAGAKETSGEGVAYVDDLASKLSQRREAAKIPSPVIPNAAIKIA